jgi:hypothetical protein
MSCAEEHEMVEQKSWKEFKASGLLWWINMILHTFGWSIVTKIVDGEIVNVYPARVRFRGFDEKSNSEGYIKVSKYLSEHSKDLLDEANEE